MTKENFENYLREHSQEIEEIALSAIDLHKSVGQTYDKELPYGFHLSMVAENAIKYGHLVVLNINDILPLIFGAYYHDSIEDARLTYNDVNRTAQRFMSAEQSFVAAEIVFALTNDKGRTRSERAGDQYYLGIRETPFAPFVKLCDRLANMSYSFKVTEDIHNRMQDVYESEWSHFLGSITSENADIRYSLPQEMIDAVEALFKD